MGVCGNVCCVAAVVKNSVFLSLECMLCVCVGDVMDVVFSVCIVRRGAVGARVWSVSVSSCRCCMFVSCVLCASYGSSQRCVLHDLQFVSLVFFFVPVPAFLVGVVLSVGVVCWCCLLVLSVAACIRSEIARFDMCKSSDILAI